MRFFMLSDLHLGKPENDKKADENIKLLCSKIRKEISDEDLLFVFLGDIIDGGNLEGYKQAEKLLCDMQQSLNEYNAQYEFIPGNHDLIEGKLDYFDDFIKKTGAKYSFMDTSLRSKEYGGVNFIFADSTLTRDYSSSGKLDLDAIRTQVKNKMQNIIFCHHALSHHSEDEHNCIENGREVSSKLRKIGIDFYFHSHTHTCDISLSEEYVNEIGCGTISKNTDDMPGIFNQFSVGGILDGKVRFVERWLITADGQTGFATECLFPVGKEFTDPEKIAKKESHFDVEHHIVREIAPTKGNNLISKCKLKTTLKKMLGENGRIFLIGDAGDGKTIELQFLANELYNTPYFPVFYSLKDYTGDEISNILPVEYRDLNPNRIVLIFDGYDEIQEKYRHDFEGRLNTYLERTPSVRVIVSSRRNFCKISEDSRSNTLRNFTEFEFETISEKMIDEHLLKLGINQKAFKESAVLSQVGGLLFNPFYLDNLSKIYIADQVLPSKGHVMEKIIEKRFWNDDAKFSNSDLEETKYKHFQCLENVAFAMRLMCKSHFTNKEYQNIIPLEQRKIIKPSGLFSRSDEYWQFTHNNFCEYLAAKCLAKMPLNRVLEICCIGNEIKPNWANTFGYIISMSGDGELQKWAKDNACETLVKYQPDNLFDTEKFEIFKHVFKKYEHNYISSYDGLCSEAELGGFACNIQCISYLIDKINTFENQFSLHNTLRIMQHLPDTCGMQTPIKDCLFRICEGYPKVKSYNCRSAIHVICQLRLTSSEITDRLMELFSSSTDDHIRTAMYEYLVHTNEQDKYVQFFLDGINLIEKSNRIANESWALNKGLEEMSTFESVSVVLEYLCEPDNQQFYESEKVFSKLSQKSVALYRDGNHKIFDTMFNCWWRDANYKSMKYSSEFFNFFTETDSIEEALLKMIEIEKPQNFYFGIKFTPEITDVLERLYTEDKVSDKTSFVNFVRDHCDANAYERLASIVNNGGEILLPELSPVVDHEKERKKAALEYLSCLLDKSKYIEVFNDLVLNIGNDNITVKELRKKRLDGIYYIVSNRVRSAIIRRMNPQKRVLDFWYIINTRWQLFVIAEIFDLMEQENIELEGEDKDAVINIIIAECESGIFNDAVSKEGYLSTFAYWLVRLLVALDIFIPQTELLKLTVFPWYCFSKDNLRAKYTFLEKYLPRKDLINKVVSDVNSRSVDNSTLSHSIDYLLECQCKDIVDATKEICLQNNVDEILGSSAIKYLHDLFGIEYIELEILPKCDKEMAKRTAITFKDIKQEKLKPVLERFYSENPDPILQKLLISLNDEKALEDYYSSIHKTNSVKLVDNELFGGTTDAISSIKDANLIPLLEKLALVMLDPNFIDGEFGGLRKSLREAFIKCAKEDLGQVLGSIDNLQRIAKDEYDIAYFRRLKNEIQAEIIKNQDVPLPIEEVKNILKKIEDDYE